jgi:hypothetical protein
MPPRRYHSFPLIYWVIVAGLFSFAAWQRYALPLDPIADPDTWGYLAPALKKLTGSDFSHEGRNFIYPGFLFLLLRLFSDFRSITIAQHLLGLAAGGLLLMIWRRARLFVAEPRVNAWAHEGLGLVAATIFFFAGDPRRVEMQIRPEGVCAFVLALNLWFAVEFIARTFVEKRPPSVGLGTGLVLTAIILASLKPSFIFLVLISVFPVGFVFMRRGFFSQKIRLAASAGAGALLLVVPEYFLSRHDYVARMFLPTTLFVVHADMIRDQMGDDLEHRANVPYPREWLARVHAELREEIEKSKTAGPEHFSSLGFSPDYLMYQPSIAIKLAFEFEDDPSALTAFYRYYYWRSWQHRPVAMLKKVLREMGIFYALTCPAYDRSKFLLLTESYRLSLSSLNTQTYPDVWKGHAPAVDFMSRTQSLVQNAPAIVQPRILRRALTSLARAYLPLLAITVIFAVATFLHANLRRRIGWLAVLAMFVFSYNAAACLEVAIINSLDVPRYLTVQMFFTLLAEFIAAWLVLEFLLQRIRWGRPIQTSAPGE